MKISVLDYGLLDEGQTVAQVWQGTLALARRAEELGYHRFWLAEHHNVPALTISSPEILMTYLASQTSQIRIGSGGIMGLHYSPYKIAELAASLETLFPGRIDLGLGNSTGTALVSKHHQSHYKSSQFQDWLEQFQTHLNGQGEDIDLVPGVNPSPQVFTLGMGGSSMQIAADLGLGYVYGSFPYISHDPLELAASLAERYRQDFRPSEQMGQAHFALALFVAIAETEEEAENLAKSLDIWMLGKQDFAEFAAFPSLVTYEHYPLSEEDRERISQHRQRLLVGNPQQVKDRVQALVDASRPDEIIFVPLVAGIDQRIKSIELLAELFTG